MALVDFPKDESLEPAATNPWTVTAKALMGFVGVMDLPSFLAGCQTTRRPKVVTKVVERKVEVPASLPPCSSEPKAGTVWVSQKDVGGCILKLATAGKDCRAKLDAVRRVLAKQ